MRRCEKLSNGSLYVDGDGGCTPRAHIEFVERCPRLLPHFGSETEFDHVLSGYFIVTPRPVARDRHRNARLRDHSSGRSFRAVRRRRKRGDLKWPGKHRRLLKCRSAWKSTCTPARRASKPLQPPARLRKPRRSLSLSESRRVSSSHYLSRPSITRGGADIPCPTSNRRFAPTTAGPPMPRVTATRGAPVRPFPT
jgi:hypothetical protein